MSLTDSDGAAGSGSSAASCCFFFFLPPPCLAIFFRWASNGLTGSFSRSRMRLHRGSLSGLPLKLISLNFFSESSAMPNGISSIALSSKLRNSIWRSRPISSGSSVILLAEAERWRISLSESHCSGSEVSWLSSTLSDISVEPSEPERTHRRQHTLVVTRACTGGPHTGDCFGARTHRHTHARARARTRTHLSSWRAGLT